MVVCLTSARFVMTADILRQGRISGGDFEATDTPGEWVLQQDPDSGEIIRIWQPNTQDDPDTPDVDESAVLESFACEARGIIDGGIRVAGTTERFGELYDNVDFVKLTFPRGVTISKRDRITNIRDASGSGASLASHSGSNAWRASVCRALSAWVGIFAVHYPLFSTTFGIGNHHPSASPHTRPTGYRCPGPAGC